MGDDGHAQVGGDEVLDGVDVIHLQADVEVADVFHVARQAAFKQAARARVLAPQDQALRLELLQGDGAALGQGMPRRHHHTQVIQVQQFRVAVLERHGAVHDGEVQLIVAQAVAELLHGDDADVGVGMRAAIAAEHAPDEGLAAARGDAHGEVAQLLFHIRQGAPRAVADGFQPPGVFEEHFTLRSKR